MLGDAQHVLAAGPVDTVSGPGPSPDPGLRLGIGGGAGGVESDVAFHLLHDLVDMAVQDRHRTEAAQIGQRFFGIAGAPAPGFLDGPHRHMREDHDRACCWSAPPDRPSARPADRRRSRPAAGLEIHHIDQGDEMHALVIEAVIAAIVRALPKRAKYSLPVPSVTSCSPGTV